MGVFGVTGAILSYLVTLIFNRTTRDVDDQAAVLLEVRITLARIETKLECLPKLKGDVDAAWSAIREIKADLRAPRPS